MTTSTLWIQNPLAIFTANDANADGGLVVRGQEIVELVAKGQTPMIPVDSVYDASESVVLPGLVNVHHHFYQTLTRAHPDA